MNTNEAMEATRYLMALFPAWKPTPELLGIMRDAFAVDGLTLEDARGIARAHVQEQTYGTPSIGAITKAVRTHVNRRIVDAQRQRQAEAAGQSTHTHRTFSEWAAFYRSIEGRTEWETLPANVRRGLRWIFRISVKGAD